MARRIHMTAHIWTLFLFDEIMQFKQQCSTTLAQWFYKVMTKLPQRSPQYCKRGATTFECLLRTVLQRQKCKYISVAHVLVQGSTLRLAGLAETTSYEDVASNIWLAVIRRVSTPPYRNHPVAFLVNSQLTEPKARWAKKISLQPCGMIIQSNHCSICSYRLKWALLFVQMYTSLDISTWNKWAW